MNPDYKQFNETIAAMYLKEAILLGDGISPSYLIELYLSSGVVSDDDLEYYLDVALSYDPDSSVGLEMLAFYSEKAESTNSIKYFDKYYDLLETFGSTGDVKGWYEFGYRKYQVGDYDRALLAFAFCAISNDIK